jgi:hypothetical protein
MKKLVVLAAGSQPQNSNHPKSVSQYDVACFQVSQHRGGLSRDDL